MQFFRLLSCTHTFLLSTCSTKPRPQLHVISYHVNLSEDLKHDLLYKKSGL